MAHLDFATRERLEQLRATDTIGLYASDEPSMGSDRDGALTVTIDPTLRVQQVQVHSVDALRTPAQVRDAFEAAYHDALSRRLPDSDDGQEAGTAERPVARRVRRISARPTRERLDRHQIRYRERNRPATHIRGEVTGTSQNDCVSVTLGPASPRGVLEVDPGWLATTVGSRLGGAITEAFHDAYARRDES